MRHGFFFFQKTQPIGCRSIHWHWFVQFSAAAHKRSPANHGTTKHEEALNLHSIAFRRRFFCLSIALNGDRFLSTRGTTWLSVCPLLPIAPSNVVQSAPPTAGDLALFSPKDSKCSKTPQTTITFWSAIERDRSMFWWVSPESGCKISLRFFHFTDERHRGQGL